MLWMIRWAGTFPIFVKDGKGAHFVDVDGNEYIDFCLGDTGAMTGHAPEATVEAIIQQAKKGITYMLPTEDVIWVGEELQRRFGYLIGNLHSLQLMQTGLLSVWQGRLLSANIYSFSIIVIMGRLMRHLSRSILMVQDLDGATWVHQLILMKPRK